LSLVAGLSEEVDVYHDWIDACEKVNKADAGGGQPNKRRRVGSEGGRDDDDDE